MRNKKNRKITRSEGKKTRQPLTMEDFMAIHDAAPTFLKVAMRLAFETTHAVKEITRIKHTIPRPKEGVCGIVWNDKRRPMYINGIEVYGTLYILEACWATSESVRNVSSPIVSIVRNADKDSACDDDCVRKFEGMPSRFWFKVVRDNGNVTRFLRSRTPQKRFG